METREGRDDRAKKREARCWSSVCLACGWESRLKTRWRTGGPASGPDSTVPSKLPDNHVGLGQGAGGEGQWPGDLGQVAESSSISVLLSAKRAEEHLPCWRMGVTNYR